MLRNYLYISDAKVDAYLGQMQTVEKKKLAVRLGIDLKILTASAEASGTLTENRVTRLEAVEDRIREEAAIGSIAEGRSWIDDEAMVHPASFGDRSESMLFFLESTPDHILGLAGSARHVIGSVAAEGVSSSMSHLHSLIANLRTLDTYPWAYRVAKSDETVSGEVYIGVSGSESWPKILYEAMTRSSLEGPPTSINFLARRLTTDTFGRDKRRYVLATPLYIVANDV